MSTRDDRPTTASPVPTRKSLTLTPFSKVINGISPSGGGACVPTFRNSVGCSRLSAAIALAGPWHNNRNETDPAMWEATHRLSTTIDGPDGDDVDGTSALATGAIRKPRMMEDLVKNMGFEH
mmetsp:Transcript_42989/g.124982  ORF Transcript_42989/g.124982 Transcript_42989/m.124982 type:complete len:122 (-) Transcript_42989:42-407(-)